MQNDGFGTVPDKAFDEFETAIADIRMMAETGASIIEPIRTRNPSFTWDDILIMGAHLARVPLNPEESINTGAVIGPSAAQPLVIDTPVFIMHMSYGALSKEAKLALAQGSAEVRIAMCSGEGGKLLGSKARAHKYIFEYVPNQYSVREENLAQVDAVEIKIGQSAKPSMSGHLPAEKVTPEIVAIRGFKEVSILKVLPASKIFATRKIKRPIWQWRFTRHPTLLPSMAGPVRPARHLNLSKPRLQFRICNTGNCPTGIATQDLILRARLDVDAVAHV